MGLTNSIENNPFGWRPDLPDIRDKHIHFSKKTIKKNKSSIDLRSKFPPAYNQQNLGSSTACAICSIISYMFNDIDPSIMFLYYNQRKNTNTINFDSGSSIRNGFKIINKIGICDESLCPYQVEYYNISPSSNSYNKAIYQHSIQYKRVIKDIKEIKACLSQRIPVIFGFSVYTSFEEPLAWNPKTDSMPYPNKKSEKLIGGQCGVIVGYTQNRKSFIIRYSKGNEWGMNGHFLMPYKYILSDACRDFWIVELDHDQIILEKPENINEEKNEIISLNIRDDEEEVIEDDYEVKSDTSCKIVD